MHSQRIKKKRIFNPTITGGYHTGGYKTQPFTGTRSPRTTGGRDGYKTHQPSGTQTPYHDEKYAENEKYADAERMLDEMIDEDLTITNE